MNTLSHDKSKRILDRLKYFCQCFVLFSRIFSDTSFLALMFSDSFQNSYSLTEYFQILDFGDLHFQIYFRTHHNRSLLFHSKTLLTWTQLQLKQ